MCLTRRVAVSPELLQHCGGFFPLAELRTPVGQRLFSGGLLRLCPRGPSGMPLLLGFSAQTTGAPRTVCVLGAALSGTV